MAQIPAETGITDDGQAPRVAVGASDSRGDGRRAGGLRQPDHVVIPPLLDRRLAEHEYVADDYSVADIAIWPWISRFEWQTIDMNQYPNVKRWYLAIAQRPAVQKGYKVPKDVGDVPMP